MAVSQPIFPTPITNPQSTLAAAVEVDDGLGGDLSKDVGRPFQFTFQQTSIDHS